MLEINMADVMNIVNLCIPYLIGFVVVLAVAIVAMIVCRKKAKSTKFMVRSQSGVAIFLALIIVVNLICFGPMSSMITLATGDGAITDETLAEAEDLVEEIADEGSVLLDQEHSRMHTLLFLWKKDWKMRDLSLTQRFLIFTGSFGQNGRK